MHKLLVLHMAEMDGAFVLWAETTRKRTTRVSHPWGATAAELAPISDGRNITAKAWIPAAGNKPLPSSSMISDTDSSPTSIAPWKVEALILRTKDAINLLYRAFDKRILEAGVVAGEDMVWWTEVVRLAGSMVARQQYLPDIESTGTGYTALWRPVFVGEDAKRLETIASRMPAVVRAVTTTNTNTAPQRPAGAILWNAISNMVDSMVRPFALHSGRRRVRFDSIHDAWLYALQSGYNSISGDNVQLRQLAMQVREWQRPVAAMASSPFRLCFRVEEPQNGSDGWYVRYLIQPRDDPSMLIPADAAWEDADKPKIRSLLLMMLGQAADICPQISAGLTKEGPSGHQTDTMGAHHFLTQDAEALQLAGYGVMLPAWWTGRRNRRLAAKARVRSVEGAGSGMLSMRSVMEFDWEVALGDESITMEELEEIAEIKSSLVRVRGQWMEVGAEEIRAAIDILKKGRQAGTLQDAIRMNLGMGNAPEDLEWGGINAADSVQDVLDMLDGSVRLEEIKTPENFKGVLRPYQLRGYSWLAFLRQWGLGGCLADDMGLGKTIQVLAMLQHDTERGESRPVLLACPTSVINNWKREAARFTPGLSVLVHHGTRRPKEAAFLEKAAKHNMVVTSYGLLQRDIETIRKTQWSGIVLDEAQNIKNRQTKQAQAVRSIHADYKFALTGTPVENSIADLWSIMEFLNPGFLGGFERFRSNFILPIQTGHGEEGAAKKLRRATSPFILRRLKTDKSVISDLPDKMEIKEYCNLTREQATLYASILKESELAMAEAEGVKRRGIILATLSKLKQVCNHPAHLLRDNSAVDGRSGKLTRLVEMLEEIMEAEDKALIFTQFVEMGHILKRHIQETFGREVLFLHGGTPRRQRDTMVERFGGEEVRIFIVSLKAGGTGLNLTAASHVFHYDRWWNPAVEDQATDRAYRIGQTRNVQVRKMICVGTLEEKIDRMIENKKEIAGSVVGTGEGWLTKLSNDELKEILSLSREAVA